MKVKNRKRFIILLCVVFYLMILGRDIFGFNIPSILYSLIWILVILISDEGFSTAFTVASVVWFASTLSITIPIYFYLLMFFLRRKAICKSSMIFCTIAILLIECLKFFQFPDQTAKSFINSAGVIILVAIICVFQIKKNTFNPVQILAFFLVSGFVLSLDILILTIKYKGTLSALISSSFRIGLTDFDDASAVSTMSINANGIGLLAIMSIVCVFFLLRNNLCNKTLGYPVLVYFFIIGMLTVSKTFFLFICILFAVMVMNLLKQKSYNPVKVILLIVFGSTIIYLFTKTSLYNNIILRFVNSASKGDLTTGRTDVSLEYLSAFFSSNGLEQLFGFGLQNLNRRIGISHSPHNATIEILACFGISGLIIYMCFFITLLRGVIQYNYRFNCKKVHIIDFIPFIIYLGYIQALQFARVTYIYGLIIIVTMCMCLSKKTSNYST